VEAMTIETEQNEILLKSNSKKLAEITEQNVKSLRPGFGLHPKYYNEVLGKKVNADIEAGTRFNLNYLQV
jgi:pseudaminic acid synthase